MSCTSPSRKFLDQSRSQMSQTSLVGRPQNLPLGMNTPRFLSAVEFYKFLGSMRVFLKFNHIVFIFNYFKNSGDF